MISAGDARGATGVGARKRARRWWIRLSLLPLSLLIAEGALRLWLQVQGRPYDAGASEERLQAGLKRFGGQAFDDLLNAGDEDSERISHPFYAWETKGGVAEIDAHYRALQEGQDDAFEVWVLGGSVAEIFAQPEQGADRLAEILGADPRFSGKPVRVHNYARASFKQPQQLMVLSFLLSLGLEPDVVVNLDGFNEVAIGTSNGHSGVHPAFPSLPMWGALLVDPESDQRLADAIAAMAATRDTARRWAGRVLSLRLHRSCLVGTVAIDLLERAQREWSDQARDYAVEIQARSTRLPLRGPDLAGRTEALPRVILTDWIESSRNLAAICASRSIQYLHVLQPTMRDPGSKRLSAEEQQLVPLNDDWMQGVLVGYPLLRDAAERLGELGVSFLDASMVFADVDETLYVDPIHFGAAGNRLLAERIGAALLSR